MVKCKPVYYDWGILITGACLFTQLGTSAGCMLHEVGKQGAWDNHILKLLEINMNGDNCKGACSLGGKIGDFIVAFQVFS